MSTTQTGGWLSFTNVKEMVAIGVVAISGIVWAVSLQSAITANSQAILEIQSHHDPVAIQTLQDNIPTALAAVNARFVNDEQNDAARFASDQAAIQQSSQSASANVAQLQAELHESVTAINQMSTQLSTMSGQIQLLIGQIPIDGRHPR